MHSDALDAALGRELPDMAQRTKPGGELQVWRLLPVSVHPRLHEHSQRLKFDRAYVQPLSLSDWMEYGTGMG